jgi:multicomponent Na+:H+ antiporter subunit B
LKIPAFIVTLITGAVLVYGTLDMPPWGDPASPASLHVSPRYIQKAVEETATPNIVTAVLGDYRGYDTMGETAVIFSAGVACLFLLKRRRKKNQ